MESFDSYLAEAGFKINSRHPIFNWETTAREIYAPQLLDPKFASEFNVYLWMTGNFFGNTAMAYQLRREGDLNENLEELMKTKSNFRLDISKKLDDPINFMVNLDKLSVHQPAKIGKQGTINIGSSPLQEGYFEGRWDNFFFKYIHTSDNYSAYEREKKILKVRGIYDNLIKEEQWEQMKKTGTLIPLKMEESYING
ncbi:hypothetical protein KAJ38_03505 [Candidatus Pacearchaeota archaeon]|nr:hypothetical protein [Candidatus Pacearchaeota archaeon]